MSKTIIENFFGGNYESFYGRFLPRLGKVRGNQIMAVCPFHDDHDPSLSVNLQTGLFKCFGCGVSGDIFTFYAMKNDMYLPDDFITVLTGICEEFGINNGNEKYVKQIVSARYEYQDESGNILYQIERLEPGKNGRKKDFRFRRSDGNGGWIYNTKGAKIIPYHLPGVLNADEIIIVEGEKDCDQLAALGYAATTNPFGAERWPSDFGPYFKGKNIVIIPDNDDTGRRHMHKVAASLKGYAASIKWLAIPDLPEKGDASDFIATFSKQDEVAERLAIMIDSAPPYSPPDEISSMQESTDPSLCLQDTATPESDLLTFPDIMSGAAGDYADVYSRYMEPPKHFLFMSYLTCLGNILTKRLIINSEISPEPRYYTVIIGESADDRKSTAINKTTRFFEDAIQDFAVCHGVGSAEGLQIKLKKSPKVVLCFDEFKAFVSKCKIESSVLLPCVTTLFESDKYEAHTAKSSITIDNASLSILGACTIDTYEQIMDAHFLAIGFPNRLFLVSGKGQRRFSFPHRIPDDEKLRLKNRLQEVLDIVGERLELEISDAARTLYDNWYMNLPQSVHSKRLDTYAMRFMGLLAVNDLKKEIDEETVLKAIALCDWQYKVRKTYDPIDADNAMAKLEEKIRRVVKRGPKTDRDLQRAVNSRRCGIWMYQMALKNLMDKGQVCKKGKQYFLIKSEVPSDLPSPK